MALILKQEANANVTTPSAGSGAVFLNSSDQLVVKDSAGNTSAIPTFTATNNTAVFFNDGGALGESANLTFVKTTNTLTVTNGNLVAGGVKTDNLYYANGNPWDLSDPGGSNTQIQFNDNESFGGSANFVWNNSTNTLSVTGTSNVTGTMNVTGNISGGNVNAGNTLTANFVAGTLTTAAQPNITSVGTLSTLTTSGNAVIGGNLTVNGNITYINVETFDVEDPIISVGGGPNGAPLTTNDGKDRGMLMHYYTVGGAVDAFMGWDNSNSEFAFGSNVTTVNDVETFNTFGNVRASTFLGNVVGATANFSGNIIAANANLGNVVTGNYFTGVLTFAAQPNITSVGTLQSLLVGATASTGDFTNAKTISSQDNSGGSASDNIGLAAEAVASSANTSITGIGLLGVARANSATKGTGVQGEAKVTNTADTGAAVGVRGYATDTHAGGYNIGVLGNAIGSGVGNYAFYLQNGGIGSIENATFWDLTDNSAAALTFNSTGKANIFGIETTDNVEGIFTTGYLNVTGNITAVAGIKTDNYYYANGSPVDFQQAGGTNTQVQFNDANGFGGSAAFTFDKTSNLVSMGGALSVTGNANVGNIGAANGVFTNVSGNGASLSSITGANVTGTVATATTAGTVTTAAQPNITSVGTLSSLTVSGNASAGNLNTAGKVVASTLESNVATGTAPLAVASTTRVANLNVDYANVSDFSNLQNNTSSGSRQLVFSAGSGNQKLLTTDNFTVNPSNAYFSATSLGGTLTTSAQPNITSVGTLTSLGVTGNITAGNVSAGNVSATTFTGALSGAATTAGTVTTAAQPNITSVGTLTSLGVSGTVTASAFTANTGIFTGNGAGLTNLAGGNVTGQVANALVAGTVYTAAQPNITSVGTLSSLAVTANVAAGNLTTTGVLSVTGTGTSSIAGNLDMTSNNIINLATPVNSTDAATKQYVDDVAQGLHTHDACQAATPDTLANISGGTVTYNNGTSGVGATLTTTGSYTTIDGVSLTNGMRILVKNEANTAHNGIYDRTSSTVLTRSSDFDTPTEMAGGDFTFVQNGTLYDNTGWVMPDAVTTVGTSAVVWVQFSGAGTYTAGTGLTLTGSQFSVNVAQPQITSVGTLTSLAVTGNITAGNVSATTFTGALSGAATTAGTVTTAAQPNITSVGTLSSLNVSGNANVGNIGGTNGVFTNVSGSGLGLTSIPGANVTGTVASATTAGTVTTAAQPNITSVGTLTSLAVTGNVSAANLTGAHYGNGSALEALNASNITSGTLAQARLANASLSVNGQSISLGGSGIITANTTQTLTLGTYLTGTSFNGGTAVTAAVDATSTNTASKVVARDASGNFAAGTITATLSGAATTAGTVTTAAQPNITSVGTLTSLSVSGALTTTNITTGANSTAGSMTGNWTLTAGSRFNATYADLAERYVADAPYEPGTVLVFGGPHEVSVTGQAGSRRVAGVVSTNPAYLMNSECEGEFVVDLALMGRVPCKVMGPVVKGDLIVTSENAGYGKADNEAAAGTIIGKAVSSLNEHDGIVEVLVGRC